MVEEFTVPVFVQMGQRLALMKLANAEHSIDQLFVVESWHLLLDFTKHCLVFEAGEQLLIEGPWGDVASRCQFLDNCCRYLAHFWGALEPFFDDVEKLEGLVGALQVVLYVIQVFLKGQIVE